MKDTIKIQLESGGEKDVPLDLIAEYGRKAPLVVIPPMPAHGQPFEQYRSGKPHCYIKLKPFNDILIITSASLEEVHKRLTNGKTQHASDNE